jgi:antibiotic biosynthesis monooxygenase (ABM) superfamily enzyme
MGSDSVQWIGLSEDAEVTTVVTRHIKPGRDKEYAEWFARLLDTIKKFPGYHGNTVVIPPGTDQDVRIVVYRFADKSSLENWENSPERKKLLSEVDNYSTQTYNKASGLETWFQLPNTDTVIPPPKWKMAIVTFLAASITSFVSRFILGPYLDSWPLVITTVIFTAILVLTLTYFAMPNLSKALRRWLYPGPK